MRAPAGALHSERTPTFLHQERNKLLVWAKTKQGVRLLHWQTYEFRKAAQQYKLLKGVGRRNNATRARPY